MERAETAVGNSAAPPLGATVIDRLAISVETLISRVDALGHRLPQRHATTGLPTREHLIEAIDKCSAPDGAGGLLGVIELRDFDRLTAFDDGTADYLLKSVVGRIARMVGPSRVVAQIDRARFAIWFGDTPLIAAHTEFDAVCYALRDRITGPNLDVLPQLASGAAEQSHETLTAVSLLARAINDLTSDPGNARLGASDAVDDARSRFVLEQDLRHAIDRGQLEMRYQPFIDAERGVVCGAEALLRWRHPDRGAISPVLFVPIAESAGLAEEIGLWALNSACGEAYRWQNEGLPGVRVAVNLSAHQLVRENLDVIVGRILHRHALAPAHLELELTETAAAGDSESAKILFEKLRALGVSIAIDDFGAGYSSLSYLKKLRFDKLKIDREFVTQVDSDRDSQAICQSIIALGRGLGISVLAEGVERWDEYAWLYRHGCKLFQGFYFSNGVEASAFVAFAKDKRAVAQLTDLSPAGLQQRLRRDIA